MHRTLCVCPLLGGNQLYFYCTETMLRWTIFVLMQRWEELRQEIVVRSIYGKYPLNPQKIATKGFSTDSGRFWCTFQHTKSLGKSKPRKCVFFSRWRPKWPPKPLCANNSVTMNSNVMILVSIPRFLGARNTLRSSKMMVAHYVT